MHKTLPTILTITLLSILTSPQSQSQPQQPQLPPFLNPPTPTPVPPLPQQSPLPLSQQQIHIKIKFLIQQKQQIVERRGRLLLEIQDSYGMVGRLRGEFEEGIRRVVGVYGQYFWGRVACEEFNVGNGWDSQIMGNNSTCHKFPKGPQFEELTRFYLQKALTTSLSTTFQHTLSLQTQFHNDSSSSVQILAGLLLYFRQKQSNKTTRPVATNIYNVLNVKRVGVARLARSELILLEDVNAQAQLIAQNATDINQTITTKQQQLIQSHQTCQSTLTLSLQTLNLALSNLVQQKQTLTKQHLHLNSLLSNLNSIKSQLLQKTVQLHGLVRLYEGVVGSVG